MNIKTFSKKNVARVLLLSIPLACGHADTHAKDNLGKKNSIDKPSDKNAEKGNPGPTQEPTYNANSSPTATYDSLHENLFKPFCISCHNSANQSGKVDLSSYESIMNSSRFPPLIIPLQSKNSLIFNTTSSDYMPIGSLKVTPELKQLLADWIDSGARQRETDPVPTPRPDTTEPPD